MSPVSDLLQHVVARETALLVGDGINAGIPNGRPRPREILESLSDGSELAFPVAAERYEAEHGRTELIVRLRELGHKETVEPLGVTDWIASIGAAATVDIGITNAVAGALVAMDPQLILDDSSAELRAGSWQIFAPYGHLGVPASLVLTTKDEQAMGRRKPILLQQTRAAIARVGGVTALLDVAEVERLLALDYQAIPTEGILRECVVVGQPNAFTQILEGRGYRVQLIPLWGDLVDLLPRPSSGPRRDRHRPLSSASSPDGNPFRYLNYFDESDADLFFGRDLEVEQLARILLGDGYCLLLGSSGVGKTSLVNAGLFPEIRQSQIRVAMMRAFDDPVRTLLESVFTQLERTLPDRIPTATENLVQLLDRATSRGPRVLVAIDQFEEVFTRLGEHERRQFLDLIFAIHEARPARLTLLMVLRDDMLSVLMEFDSRASAMIQSHFVLRRFDPIRGLAALSETADIAGWLIPVQLQRQIVEDLDDRGVDPAHLQIVCSSLYEEDSTGSSLTMEAYLSAGGARAILSDYLDSVLTDLTEEWPLARIILKSLVTLDMTKSVMTVADVHAEATFLGSRATVNEVEASLSVLVDRRVLRTVSEPEAIRRYELCHDLLAHQVHSWLDTDEAESKYVWHVLRSSATDWRTTRSLPDFTKWTFLSQISPLELSDVEDRALLLISALNHCDAWEHVGRHVLDIPTDTWLTLREWLTDLPLKVQHGLVEAAREDGGTEASVLIEALAVSAQFESLRRSTARALADGGTTESEGQPIQVDWILVPGGPFEMGTDDPSFRFSAPVREECVGAFKIQKYPVTCFEYAQFLRDTGRAPPHQWVSSDPPRLKEELPIVGVTWYDAVAYCQWYGGYTGETVRLPTEAEWECAATWDHESRTKRRWGSSDEFIVGSLNCREGGLGAPTPIGAYSPGGDGPCGAVEMCGNTFDWVEDWWHEAGHERSASDTLSEGVDKVARGGSWAGSHPDCSGCSHAYKLHPDNANEYVGFRMALTLIEEETKSP